VSADLRTRIEQSNGTLWPGGLARAPRRFGSQLGLLLLSILIMAQPITGLVSLPTPDTSLIARADRLVPLGTSLQSVRPDLSQHLSILCRPKQVFLHAGHLLIVGVREGHPFHKAETVHYARFFGWFHSGRSPPFSLS